MRLLRHKKIIALVIMGLICTITAWAAGKKDVDSYNADNPAGFTNSVNIEGKEPGKYNFYIEARDKANNTGIAGPYNITIDRESDIPALTIINPHVNMVVPGNLNIVGICVDDDGIGYVELVITRGSDGKGEEMMQARANGAEFWSYFLDTTDSAKWQDGIYTITAWGVDSNGLSGVSPDIKPAFHKKHQVSFYLNRKKPEITVTSHSVGALVAGNVTVRGTVYDSNGVNSLSYRSEDSNYQNIPLKYDKKNNIYNWNLTFDTRKFKDGPIVINFQAEDNLGTTGVSALLLLSNNTKPKIDILSPEPDATVGGQFAIAGTAKHPVGLKSVSWKMGKESGEFAMEIGDHSWSMDFDFSGQKASRQTLEIRAEDLIGNVTVSRQSFRVDPLSELPYVAPVIPAADPMGIPVVQIILPQEGEIITADFKLSGVMYNNEAIRQVYWRFDDEGETKKIEAEHGFSITIPISSLSDNEHSVTVIAEDIHGTKSEPVTRNFRISLADPTIKVEYPGINAILKEIVEINGTAYDANGIEKLQISLDNGNTFNHIPLITGNSEGNDDTTVKWEYRFNSKIFQDGSHVAFIRVFDKYGLSAIYSSLINLDNTPPEVSLDTPMDGYISTGPVMVTGQTLDLNMEEITIEVRSFDGNPIPDGYRAYKVALNPVLVKNLDLSGLADGLYNIEISAADKAKNITRISRNIELARGSRENHVDILYPLDGEYLQGIFNMYGYTGGIDSAKTVTLSVNNTDVNLVNVADSGYYCFPLDREYLKPGWNQITVHSNFGGNTQIKSPVRNLFYDPFGAWVTIDNLAMGDFANERPWLNGRAGYALNAEEEVILADKNAAKEQKKAIGNKALDYVDISFDNGYTFARTENRKRDTDIDWRFRLETEDMREGVHYILVRANMKNGETVTTRTMLQVDKTAPVIRIIAPEEGGRYNQNLEFAAMAQDNVEMESLHYYLRSGDKNSYGVPAFLQGLYVDMTIPPFINQLSTKAVLNGGATYMDFGFGLSFYDDNIKLQGQYGFFTQDLFESMGGEGKLRYGGQILSLKLLANVYTLPFGSLFGHNWDWLRGSVGVGAKFSLFDFAGQGYTQSGKPTWLSALLAEVEFPKITSLERKSLRTFSLYTEGQLWFLPTDIDSTKYEVDIVIPHIVVGLRMYIF